ncbi:MAG: hypothetical protein AB7J13_00940 [Pyrinomonadaceae bacterium]
MKRAMLIGFLLLLFSSSTVAQSAATKCPTLRMEAPRENFVPDESISYLASVDRNGWDAPLEYRWRASWPDPMGVGRVEAVIHEGQGTPWIRILKPGNQITTQVEIIGFPKGCTNTASETAGWTPKPQPKKLYAGSTSWNVTILEKLDHIGNQLNNDPNSKFLRFFPTRMMLLIGRSIRTRNRSSIDSKRWVSAVIASPLRSFGKAMRRSSFGLCHPGPISPDARNANHRRPIPNLLHALRSQ